MVCGVLSVTTQPTAVNETKMSPGPASASATVTRVTTVVVLVLCVDVPATNVLTSSGPGGTAVATQVRYAPLGCPPIVPVVVSIPLVKRYSTDCKAPDCVT